MLQVAEPLPHGWQRSAHPAYGSSHPDNKTAAVPWPDRLYSISWLLMAWRHKEKNLSNSWHAEIMLWRIETLYFLPYFQWNVTSRWTPSPWMTNIHASCIWVRSRDCGCLVTWFCYQLIAKPDNKTAAVPWPDRLFQYHGCWWLGNTRRRTYIP